MRPGVLQAERPAFVAVTAGIEPVAPFDAAVEGARVGIHEELFRAAAMARAGIPRPVHAQTVALSGTDARDVPVPHVPRLRRERDAPLGAAGVEETDLHPVRDG